MSLKEKANDIIEKLKEEANVTIWTLSGLNSISKDETSFQDLGLDYKTMMKLAELGESQPYSLKIKRYTAYIIKNLVLGFLATRAGGFSYSSEENRKDFKKRLYNAVKNDAQLHKDMTELVNKNTDIKKRIVLDPKEQSIRIIIDEELPSNGLQDNRTEL